jgi:predicted AlkP superfamily pyrophosphatase or phosphodiesterase
VYSKVARNRCLGLALAVIGVSAVDVAAQRQPPASARAAPRPPDTSPALVVVLVVDQMRADYVDRFEADWTRGLGRLMREGARFVNAAYPYLGTYTCAGHATIATGAFPHRHGLFQNTWYDREKKSSITCTHDDRARAVPYVGWPTEHIGPGLLRLPTFADLLREKRGARVASMSLKARSAIMLAGHGGHAVTWLTDSGDGWETSTPYSASPVPAVKAFLDAHPIEADFGKVWTRRLPESRYSGPDAGDGENGTAGWDRTFPHKLKGSGDGPDGDFRVQWQTSPFADARLGQLAASLVETERLGQRGTTDVLMVGFSSPDLVGHRYGPRSHEVQDMYAHLDDTIGALFDRIDRLIGRERYVVVLTSDHGVAELPVQAANRGVDAGRISSSALTKVVDAAAQDVLGRGRHVAHINSNDVYFEPGVYARLQSTGPALAHVVDTLLAQPGIARVFRSEQLPGAAAAADPLLRAAALSYVPGRSGDLVLALKPGWIISTVPTTHGTANSYDQRVPLVFMGACFVPGQYPGAVTPADIAPTLGALLDFRLPQAEGRVLKEAFASTGRACRR